MLFFPSTQGYMLNQIPTSLHHSSNNFSSIFINVKSYYSHLVSPVIFSQHVLIMLHWLLTRTAPDAPNIYQQNLTFFGRDACLSFLKKFVEFSIIGKVHSLINLLVIRWLLFNRYIQEFPLPPHWSYYFIQMFLSLWRDFLSYLKLNWFPFSVLIDHYTVFNLKDMSMLELSRNYTDSTFLRRPLKYFGKHFLIPSKRFYKKQINN